MAPSLSVIPREYRRTVRTTAGAVSLEVASTKVRTKVGTSSVHIVHYLFHRRLKEPLTLSRKPLAAASQAMRVR